MRRAIAAVAVVLSSSILSAAPNVYVTNGNEQDCVLREYTPAGSLVRSWNVPYPASSNDIGGEGAKGVAVSPNGMVHVFTGTWEPYILTLNPTTGQWSDRTFSGLSVPMSGFTGRIAAYGNYLYAADYSTGSGADVNAGIVRFDLNSGTAERFYGTGTGSINFDTVTMGNDGKLYALGRLGIKNLFVFDPISMAMLESQSGRGFNDIDVDSQGYIYGVDGSGVYKMPHQTNLAPLAYLALSPTLWNIDLSNDNAIAIGRYGSTTGFYMTDSSLQSATFRATGTQADHVSFAEAVPEPGAAAAAVLSMSVIMRRPSRRPKRSA